MNQNNTKKNKPSKLLKHIFFHFLYMFEIHFLTLKNVFKILVFNFSFDLLRPSVNQLATLSVEEHSEGRSYENLLDKHIGIYTMIPKLKRRGEDML